LSGVVAGAAGALGAGGKNGNPHPDASDNSSAGTGDATQGAGQIRQQVGFTLGSLMLVILFSGIIFGLW